VDVLIAEVPSHRHHDRIGAHLVLEQMQLLRNVDGALTGESWPVWGGAVAVWAMASGADRSLGRAVLSLTGGKRAVGFSAGWSLTQRRGQQSETRPTGSHHLRHCFLSALSR